MKITRILIIGVAAWAGYFYYNRFHAMMNIAGDSFGMMGSDSPSSFGGSGYGGGSQNGGAKTVSGLGGIGPGQTFGSSYDNGPSLPSAAEENVFPLMQAAAKGDMVRVKKLLTDGVVVDGRDSERRSALMYAAWNGHNDICALLISAGAKARFQDRNGNNAYDYAASRGLSDTVTSLLAHSHTQDDNHYLEYAQVMTAAFSGNVQQLPPGSGYLASVNHLTPLDQSPLHLAVSSGSVALAQEMIRRGADVNLNNRNEQTPMHWAAWNNQTQAMALLISHDASIQEPDAAGDTPLMLAVQHNNKEAVELLLSHGANKSLKNKQEETALIIAQEKGFTDLAALLQ